MSRNESGENDMADDLGTSPGHGKAAFNEVRKPTPPGAKLAIAIMLLIGAAIGVGLILVWFNRPISSDVNSDGPSVANLLPALKLDAKPIEPTPIEPPAPAPLVFTPPPVPLPPMEIEQPKFNMLPDPVHARRLRSGLQSQDAPPAAEPASPAGPQDFMESGSFAGRLEPLRLAPSVAGTLGNRDFLITQGTMIDCTLRPRLISTQTGMFTCIAPTDTYSANGKVKLIDKGTKFVGFQSGGLVQGQDRIFVVWSRLETPSGVIVNLDSPGTGPLGEAGLGGHIDHHFMERFGNAIMLSLIFDLSSYATSRNRSGDSFTFDNTTSGAEDAIAKVLEHSLDIPPTLYKNQGERISILVARDLDFSKVYDLKPTQ